MKTGRLLIILPLVMGMYCGEPGNLYISVHNATDNDIDFYLADAWTNVFYPDTTLIDLRGSVYLLTASAHNTNGRLYEAYDWEYITRKWTKKDTLSVYIFNHSVLAKNSWEEVQNGYMIEVRYDLSSLDLKDCQGKLTFPPNEKMKNIHMWPSYEELVTRYGSDH